MFHLWLVSSTWVNGSSKDNYGSVNFCMTASSSKPRGCVSFHSVKVEILYKQSHLQPSHFQKDTTACLSKERRLGPNSCPCTKEKMPPNNSDTPCVILRMECSRSIKKWLIPYKKLKAAKGHSLLAGTKGPISWEEIVLPTTALEGNNVYSDIKSLA